MTDARIAVTGATGSVGGSVARLLADQGRDQTLLVRDPGRAPELPGAEVRAFDYRDRDLARRALDGVDVLFLVSAPESADRLELHRTAIAAAAGAGVGHVVYTSFQGAAPDATFTLARDHFATEQLIEGSGVHWTFLRDNFYLDFLPALVGEDDVIRGPAGQGRVAAVTRADVARVAAAVLQQPDRHRDVAYELTGPEALTFAEVAAQLSAHTGRSVSYHDETVAEAYRSRLRWPAPQWQYDAWVTTYTAIASGELARVSTDVLEVTGVAPTSLQSYLAHQPSRTLS